MRKALDAVPGVRKTAIELDKKIATVTYDSSKTTVAKLLAAVKKVGFKASVKTG